MEAILFTSFGLNYAVFKKKINPFEEANGKITSKKHSTVKMVEIGEFLAKESRFV